MSHQVLTAADAEAEVQVASRLRSPQLQPARCLALDPARARESGEVASWSPPSMLAWASSALNSTLRTSEAS